MLGAEKHVLLFNITFYKADKTKNWDLISPENQRQNGPIMRFLKRRVLKKTGTLKKNNIGK